MKRWLVIGICLVVVSFAVLTPVYRQWSYRERLMNSVPIGSTRDAYLKAMLADKLGQGIPRPGYTFWRPIQFHGFIYTIVALPSWDTGGHLVNYDLYPRISMRGHVYFLSQPPPQYLHL